MKLKNTVAVLVAVMCLAIASLEGFAAEMTWNYDETNATVSVKGYGMINDATGLMPYLKTAKKIEVMGGVTKIDKNVFADCGIVEEVVLPEGMISIGDNSFSLSKMLKKINFPDTLENIGNEAFMGCSDLESVTIPKSLSSIGKNAFSSCEKIKEFKVDEENQNFKEIDGVLFSKDGTELVMYPPGKTDESYTLPQGTEKIHQNAFSYNNFIETAVLPDTVSEIGDYAFFFCEKLNTIDFGTGIKKVGDYAFYASKLKRAVLPYGTQSIGKYAFKNCDLLTRAEVPGTVTQIGENAFFRTHSAMKIWGYGEAAESCARTEGKEFVKSVRVMIDGAETEFDQPAVIMNNSTMVPMRKIFEALGAEVTWDAQTRTATAAKDGVVCSFAIGGNILYKNGESIELAASAVIAGGRTLVHARAVAEAFGADVAWDAGTGLVTINN